MPECDRSILHNLEQWGAGSESEELAVSQGRHPFPLRMLSPSTALPPWANPRYVYTEWYIQMSLRPVPEGHLPTVTCSFWWPSSCSIFPMALVHQQWTRGMRSSRQGPDNGERLVGSLWATDLAERRSHTPWNPGENQSGMEKKRQAVREKTQTHRSAQRRRGPSTHASTW